MNTALAKSLDNVEVIATLLRDAVASQGLEFSSRALNLTCKNIRKRTTCEGLGFLTKTLPRLGKHFDQVLSSNIPLNCTPLGFKTLEESKLPRFLGELFSKVLGKDGYVLPDPDAQCVLVIRQILYLYYKYELPYSEVQEQEVISSFVKTEEDLTSVAPRLAYWRSRVELSRRYAYPHPRNWDNILRSEDKEVRIPFVIRRAQIALNKLFASFDPLDIIPRHGPGVVATKQRLGAKFIWTNVSESITDCYPFDEYFCSSIGNVCDSYRSFSTIGKQSLPAQVILVPKDSRGPRLISCEPVDNQWIQQGLSRSIVRLVEEHRTTRYNVHFTDQGPNGFGALLGSSTGKYATLDLKEASDRVSLDLVRLLFPEHLQKYLECCRSTSTVLPDGRIQQLRKFAPMGSALCFPILALTIWSLLSASAPDADTREGILVYGDDVIVPTAFADSAIAILEEFGLLINRSKSCTQGFFRESCGVDAFKGLNVTPVRFRTVWDESPSPNTYCSWISYANSFHDKGWIATYDLIVRSILRVYGRVPGHDFNHLLGEDMTLRKSPTDDVVFRRRWNRSLQKLQYLLPLVTTPSVHQVLPGWSMLLRYFSEASTSQPLDSVRTSDGKFESYDPTVPFSVSRYTKRHTSMLVWRWR